MLKLYHLQLGVLEAYVMLNELSLPVTLLLTATYRGMLSPRHQKITGRLFVELSGVDLGLVGRWRLL